jgi:hypothetical protein
VGIDPGLVHTGLVSLLFSDDNRTINLQDRVIAGPDARAVRASIPLLGAKPVKFIEGYRPRSNFYGDNKMVQTVAEMAREIGAIVVPNMGAKQIVRQPLMELLGVWKFSTVTHHQDLRAAARIAIFGMLKDDELNEVIAGVVRDHVDGRTWRIT